jgi:PAS domain S-box-containing protein
VSERLPDSLRSRYAIKLLGISLLIVVVVVALGTLMALQVSERVTDEQLRTAEANAEFEANELARWFEGEQEVIRVLSAHRGIDVEDPAGTRATLDAEVDQSDELESLHVAERAETQPSNGTDEQVVVSTDASAEGGNISATNVWWGEDTDENPIQYVFDDAEDVLVSWVYLDDGDMAVALASPTHDGEHVLIGEYHPSEHVEDAIHLVDGSRTVVLGGVSAFVTFDEAGPNEIRRYKGEPNTTEVGYRIKTRKDPFSSLSGSELDDEEVRGYHSVPSEGVDWVVVVETPRSNALALTQEIQRDLAALIATIVLGFLLVGAVIQYGPIRSMKRLSEQANAIAKGDLSVDFEETDRIDEVGRLRASFKNTKDYVATIARQGEKLARQEFEADELDESIPGQVGESMARMREDLRGFITELEAERERYSTLVEQSSDGVVVVRAGECVFANDRFLEITGYDRGKIVGMPFEALFRHQDREIAHAAYDRAAREATPRKRQLRIVRSDGEHRTVELSAATIDHDGASAVLINVRDITDFKRREQRLEIFNRVLRHNLRNALQVVNSALESAQGGEDANSELVSLARDRLTDLLATAETARRIERAFEDLEVVDVDLAAVCRSLAERARAEYPSAEVTVDAAPATVEAANVLEDALWELVENGLEHTGPEPRVKIEVEGREDVAVVAVGDDGPGVPDVERNAINSGEETHLQHTRGLGLWIALWTVEASGGDLSFEVEDGTTVRVTLPLATERRIEE